METVVIILVVIIIVLVERLAPANSFDRLLFPSRREYSFSVLSGRASVRFTKYANGDSLRKFLHHLAYTNPGVTHIQFDNLPPQDFSADVFYPFSFERLDFSSVDCIPGRYCHLMTLSEALPCSVLILPQNMRGDFYFSEYCRQLETLVLPSPSPLSARFVSSGRSDAPIHVHSGFCVRVPSELLHTYQSDPHWAQLRFVDENGSDVPLRFLAY